MEEWINMGGWGREVVDGWDDGWVRWSCGRMNGWKDGLVDTLKHGL